MQYADTVEILTAGIINNVANATYYNCGNSIFNIIIYVSNLSKNMNNNDSSTIFNIIIITLIIGVLLACYIYTGKRKESTIEKIAPDTKYENMVRGGSTKELKPYEKYRFNYTYVINSTGNPYNVSVKIPIPQNDNEKQYISSLRINPRPTKTYKDGEDTIAEFFYKEMPEGETIISISGIADIRTYDYQSAELINKNLKRENNLNRYLMSENLIESNDPMIKHLAQSLRGSNQRETVNKVFHYLNKAIKYRVIPQNIGAKQALVKRQGKCSEYAASMVAILRANGIPSRVVIGNIAREYSQSHVWVEVYYNNYGWVTYDPTDKGSTINLYDGKRYLGKKVILTPEKSFMRYIASQRNTFTPIYITYNYNKYGRISQNIKTEIHKIK